MKLAVLAEQSSRFTYTNRLYIYEAAYLLMFCAWERLLEESFIRFIAGYKNGNGRMTLQPGKVFATDIAHARTLLYGTNTYLLWHSPSYAIKRSKHWFVSGAHEVVPTSVNADLEDFAAIRHFVAHRSDDSQLKFDAATLRLSGSAVIGKRAGRFLRKQTVDPVTGVSMLWIDRIAADLDRYAAQIVA